MKTELATMYLRVPQDVRDIIVTLAAQNRRSINSQALIVLETGLEYIGQTDDEPTDRIRRPRKSSN